MSFDSALAAWSLHDTFVMITNHAGCRTSDEHTVYHVEMANHDRDARLIVFKTQSFRLREVTHKLNVEIGDHITDHINTMALIARQDAATSTIEQESSTSLSTTFDYPSPTALATGTSLAADVSFSRLNTTLLPPDSSIVEFLPYANIHENIRLSCQNCTMTGNIELKAGGFSVTDSDPEVLMDFFDDGFLEFDATNIAAMMDFELELLPGLNVLEYTAQLPSIPLGAIVIAGVLKFGPVLDLAFPMAITLNSPVVFRTGFNLFAPPSTKIYLNMSEPNSSFTSGLSETKLEALPFTANTEALSFNLTIGFNPQLILGAGIGSDTLNASADGGIGVYLDLPQLATTVDMVDRGDENCEPSVSEDAQDGLIRVSSSAMFGGGAQWDVGVEVLNVGYEHGEAVPLLETEIVLPVQCLMWDDEVESLVKAVPLQKVDTSSDENGNGGSKQNLAVNVGPMKATISMCMLAVVSVMLFL
ncbi:hypothetical protein LTR64_002427 [Lithohypha guttulata]|uniref:uncharacterized protein n=1 Tax=Lithohypha guttulata TaxID=1690604 RepID=UPI002DDE0C43|nr:hypothetical protein LTR51_001348 [Lithohypha guttulata]